MGIFQKIQYKISSSLELRVIVIFSSIITAFWLVFILINSIIIYSENFKELTIKGNGLAKRLAGIVTKDMQYFDYVKLEAQLKHYFIEDELLYAVIFNANGEAVAFNIKQKDIGEKKIVDNAIRNTDKQVKHLTKRVTGNSLLFAYPIIDENDNLWGYVNILLSLNAIKHKLLIRLIIFILSALLAFVTEITILKRLTHKIVSPTSKLIDIAHKIAETQDLSLLEQTNIPAKGELVLLFEALKKMLLDINQYQKDITLNQSIIAIGQSTAMVAHDVRKPLTSMKALLSSLPAIKNDPEQLKKMIINVDRSISQTNTLLNDILEFSRDSTSLNLSETDPQGIIVSALSDALRNHTDASAKISYDLKHSHVLHVDSNRIVRVLINIMDNAMDAMELNRDGKFAGLLQISTNEIEREGKRFISISVADNGHGLSEEALAKIFDPFFTQGKAGGTGLGLAICHKIISMHGGRIEAANRQDGNGAVFTIELPVGEKPAEINETELIYSSNELEPFREEEAKRVDYGDTVNTSEFMRINKERGRQSYLLIVDDEPLFRESIRCLLNELGQVKDHVKIVEADSAEKALTLFESQEFDYVIADIDMGKMRMNGYKFTGMVLDQYPNAHVLIHSNKRRDEMDKNIRQVGGDKFMGFLPKPMRASELLQFLACKTFETSLSQVRKAESRKKVLVLNDDEIQLMSYRLQISSPTVQVFTSTNLTDALRIYTEQGADLILSDINLGNDEPSGYDFLKCVREIDRDIPFYFVSGYSRQEEEPKAKERGATGYFQIPIKDGNLQEILS